MFFSKIIFTTKIFEKEGILTLKNHLYFSLVFIYIILCNFKYIFQVEETNFCIFVKFVDFSDLITNNKKQNFNLI
jgi:hypothetical protein